MKFRHCFRSLFRSGLVLGIAAAVACGNLASAKSDKGKGNKNGEGKGHSADFIPPGHRRAPVEVEVRQAPPALRVDVVSVRPSPAHVWVAGFWVWDGNNYVWTQASWMLPPEPKAVWVQPRFEPRTGVNIYISGYWRI